MDALGKAIPDRVLAASGAPVWALNVTGVDRHGTRFANCFFFNGGMGHGRPPTGFTRSHSRQHGQHADRADRILDADSHRAQGDPDGLRRAGKFRGGCGQTAVLRSMAREPLTISFLAERTKEAAPGIFGGLPGGNGSVKSEGSPINPKETRQWMPGERIQLSTPGGGGCGNPRERDRAALARDVEFEWVSPSRPARSTA